MEEGFLKSSKVGGLRRFRKKDIEDVPASGERTGRRRIIKEKLTLPKQKSNTIRYHDFF